MIRPRLVLATFALLVLGVAAGADAAELVGILFAQSADIVARAGLLPEPLQVHPGRAHLPALGLDDRTGSTTTASELNNLKFELWNSRRLLLRRARACPGLGDPDLLRSA